VTGTGKTVIINNILRKMKNEKNIDPVYIIFSAKTNSLVT